MCGEKRESGQSLLGFPNLGFTLLCWRLNRILLLIIMNYFLLQGAQLRKHIDATLGSGNLREAVKLPPGEDLNEWLAVNCNLCLPFSTFPNYVFIQILNLIIWLVSGLHFSCWFFQPGASALWYPHRVLYSRELPDNVCRTQVWHNSLLWFCCLHCLYEGKSIRVLLEIQSDDILSII